MCLLCTMAPLIPDTKLTHRYFSFDGVTMITAMDSESTDGENSLLSGSMSDSTIAGYHTKIVSKQLSPSASTSSHCLVRGLPRNVKDDQAFGEPTPELPSEAQLEEAFYFETDHVSMKGNSDYQTLLRSVILLESQRQKAIEDLDKLIDGKQAALRNPIDFVGKLQKRVDLDLPSPQDIGEIPAIDLDRYTSSVDPLHFKQPKHMTRHTFKRQTDDAICKSLEYSAEPLPRATHSVNNHQHVQRNHSHQTPVTYPTLSVPESATVHPASSTPTVTMLPANGMDYGGDSGECVRGRVKLTSRSATFNQLWTVEEQRQLEELLGKYPPEEVEMKRWAKIAAELGNRTTLQVASRVQKYFIKLARAGLPIPGRLPGGQTYFKKHFSHRHHRHHKLLWARSTFMASYEPPVYMTEDEEDSASQTASSLDYGEWGAGVQDDVSDEDAVPSELRDTDEYRELLHLKKLRQQKIVENGAKILHVGYKCDRCGVEPIVGVRWHCTTCPTHTSLDFCDNCADFVFETKDHNETHQLEAVREAESSVPQHVDRDYTKFMSGDYNYLDPNYMPAS